MIYCRMQRASHWLLCFDLRSIVIGCNFLSTDALNRLQNTSRSLDKAWLVENAATPAVDVLRGMPAPTALSWLRRRGPHVHHGLLFKLFRDRMIRLFSASKGTVSRVARGRLLDQGDIILFPRSILNDDPSTTAAVGGGSRVTASIPRSDRLSSHGPVEEGGASSPGTHRGPFSPEPQHGSCDNLVGSSGRAARHDLILRQTKDIIFINKPAGVEVQGPAGDSIEALMRRGELSLDPSDDLKLVHRLDRRVSGVLMVARGPDSAAWLAACLRDKSAQAMQELEEERKAARSRLGLAEAPSRWGSIPEREKLPEGLSVSRTYWALVAGRLKPGDKGRITLPVPAPGGGRRARAGSGETSAGVGPRPALTLYRVRACRDGVSWVELTPITGRRHQLRYHCYKGLSAPIVGDRAYGFKGLSTPDGNPLLGAELGREWWAAYCQQISGESIAGVAAAVPKGSRVHGTTQAGVDVKEGKSTAASALPRVMLHARTVVVNRPHQDSTRVVAPIPDYMALTMEALGWTVK